MQIIYEIPNLVLVLSVLGIEIQAPVLIPTSVCVACPLPISLTM